MNRTFTYLITQKDSPCTVESYLKKRGYSHPILVQLKKTQNGILVNQKWAYVKTILNPDDKLEIHLEETASSEHIVPVELPFSIVYEDEDILVVNKPADMPIHPSINNYENTLANAVAYYYKKQGETFMEEKIFVQMTEKVLFDFMLFHTYSKFAGFLSNVLGMAVAFIGIILTIMNKATIGQLVLYLVAAAIFVSFTPIQLKMRAKKQMQTNAEYKEGCSYLFRKENLTRVQGECETVFEWNQIEKVVSTPKTIGFYYGPDKALIVPKECFENRFVQIMQIVMQNVDMSKVNVR